MRIDSVRLLIGFSPLLLVSTAGCQLPRPHSAVNVRVVDAETKAPVPGASVTMSDVLTLNSESPENSTGTTGADGLSHLRLSPAARGDIALEVSASGHMTEVREFPIFDPPNFDASKPFQSLSRPPLDIVVEVYAEPRPVVDVTVPVGFHGPIKIEVKIDETQVHPGQRAFSVIAADGGTASLTGPGVLRHLMPVDFTVKTVGGVSVSRDVKDWEIGLHWARSSGTTHYFFVGTQRECDEYRRTLELEPAGSHSGDGKKGGGRHGGGGGRRGGGGGGRGGMGGGM